MAMFYRRAPFYSRYFKASSWSDYLYQVLYRAERSTLYLW